jgi:hypothetical protein
MLGVIDVVFMMRILPFVSIESSPMRDGPWTCGPSRKCQGRRSPEGLVKGVSRAQRGRSHAKAPAETLDEPEASATIECVMASLLTRSHIGPFLLKVTRGS